jgi:hypothetical protein
MPTRRTSPRRGATRPTAPLDRDPRGDLDDDDDPPGGLLGAAPWLALLALVLAAGTLGYVLFLRPGGDTDLTACRTAAWSAIPDAQKLPDGWDLGLTDLNANGMTISIVGGAPDAETDAPEVLASITCYGDEAAAALTQYRDAATASGATVTERDGGNDAFDVLRADGSGTTLFRVRSLVAQIVDRFGTAPQEDLQTITTAVASAMGDGRAAGAGGAPAASNDVGAGSSDDLGSEEPVESAFAPELEAVIPTTVDVPDPSGGGATVPVTLSKISARASDMFDLSGGDLNARALAARIRSLGSSMDKLQVAQAFDESGTVTLSIAAFRLPGADLDKLRSAIVETWLGAGATGVKMSEVTLGGKKLTKVDYGDEITIEYAYAKDDYVIVIDTAEEAVAEAVAAKLP